MGRPVEGGRPIRPRFIDVDPLLKQILERFVIGLLDHFD